MLCYIRIEIKFSMSMIFNEKKNYSDFFEIRNLNLERYF